MLCSGFNFFFCNFNQYLSGVLNTFDDKKRVYFCDRFPVFLLISGLGIYRGRRLRYRLR